MDLIDSPDLNASPASPWDSPADGYFESGVQMEEEMDGWSYSASVPVHQQQVGLQRRANGPPTFNLPPLLKRKQVDAFEEDEIEQKADKEEGSPSTMDDHSQPSIFKRMAQTKVRAMEQGQQQQERTGESTASTLRNVFQASPTSPSLLASSLNTPEEFSLPRFRQHPSQIMLDMDFPATPTGRTRGRSNNKSRAEPLWNDAGRRAMMLLKHGVYKESEDDTLGAEAEASGSGSRLGSSHLSAGAMEYQADGDYYDVKSGRQYEEHEKEENLKIEREDFSPVGGVGEAAGGGTTYEECRRAEETMMSKVDVMLKEEQQQAQVKWKEIMIKRNLEDEMERELLSYQECSFEDVLASAEHTISPNALIEEQAREYCQPLARTEELEQRSWMYETARVSRPQRMGMFAQR
ncbi:hypothetical protein BGZ58_003094 [Dissophora ornata]|nr:hypothetical protein BGZ58_003094 [Dissophora ornata]